jgi:predicted nucleic acid-binding protein
LIICDTGPLVSAINRGERRRHRFAAELLARLGRKVLVPWPVLVEVDLLLRARGYPQAALKFAQSPSAGIHRLDTPTEAEFELALDLGQRYSDSGADLPDLIVMAMASRRRARILTWDYRYLCVVVLRSGHHWPLVVAESDLPAP